MGRDYKSSIAMAMECISRAYIQDKSHPDYHGFYHMYDSRDRRWNRAYMELAWQVTYSALLPYYDYSGERRWLEQAVGMIVDWGVPVVMCHDKNSPAYGGMLVNNSPETWGDENGCYGGKKYHTFDSGDGLLAFLMVSQQLKQPVLEEGIRLVSDYLLRATGSAGMIKTWYSPTKGCWAEDEQIYPNSRGAWAYGYWYSISGEEKYKKQAEKYCEWTLTRQRKNGFLSPHETEVAEFMIYATEGLYWAGEYCGIKQYIDKAKFTFDAMIKARRNGPGNMYFAYHSDWTPKDECLNSGDSQKDMLSTCGQYAKLAYHFYKVTGEVKYRQEFLSTVEFMYDLQDRASSDGNMLGGWPRATNSPWTREVCPAYNYVGAVLLGRELLP